MSRVLLITGGAGYIGSHAVHLAPRFNWRPVVVDDLSQGHREATGRFPLVEASLNDREKLQWVFQRYKPQAVMHFAARCLVGESVENPKKYFEDNLNGTLCLWDAMLQAGVKFFIFSSTCATYGNPIKIPIPENHPQNPINPYGESKKMIETMLAWYEKAHGLKFTALRYFNAAGAHPSGKIGERHNPETHLIPLVLDAALGRRKAVTIFGEDYPTPDGTCVRDYVHVGDLVEAHFLALRRLQETGRSDVFNLGTGKGYSVRQVIRTVEKITGRKVPLLYGSRRRGDPPVLVADSRKARKVLKWKPKNSGLENIVETAWRFHRRVFQA